MISKPFLAIIIFLQIFFFTNSLDVHACLPEGISFHTQEEIDNFQSIFPDCTEFHGNLKINGNDINNLDGLNVLKYIGGNLIIEKVSISNMTGLENLDSIEGDLHFYNNSLLTNMSGLEDLTIIGNNLYMSYNPSLENLAGLENVSTIRGNIDFNNNEGLQNLVGLTGISSFKGMITITNNNELNSLMGLENFNFETISTFTIYENSSLTDCAVESLCNFLSVPFYFVFIDNNAPGCNNPDEVIEACATVDITKNNDLPSLMIHPNPSSNGIVAFTLQNINDHNISMTCYNSIGQQVHKEQLSPGQSESIINVRDWNADIYLLIIYTEEKVVSSAKFVVQ